jgi:hypothetical protein
MATFPNLEMLDWKTEMESRAHPARFSRLKYNAEFEDELKLFGEALDPKPHLAK